MNHDLNLFEKFNANMGLNINILQHCESELQNELEFFRTSLSIFFHFRISSKLQMRIWTNNWFVSRREIKALDCLYMCIASGIPLQQRDKCQP